LREQIDREGATVRTKSGVRSHPLLQHEAVNRNFIARTLVKLGLSVEPLRSPGRPPSDYGPSPADWER
jgi:hypothetical protein